MAQFLKFKLILTFKLIFMGVNFVKKYKNLVISKSGKSQNKVVVAEEIGIENDVVLRKIDRFEQNWARRKKVCLWMDGRVGGWMGGKNCFKDFLQQ